MSYKICEHCYKPFKASHKSIRFCSRGCLYESSYPVPGTRFEFLTIVGFSHRATGGRAYFTVECDCGTVKVVQLSGIKNGHVKSCGCWLRQASAQRQRLKKKESTGTPEWTAFHAAKSRCTNAKRKDWERYGGRGIEFRFTSVEEWLEELGPKPGPEYSVDRKDNDGHYEPGNVRWATVTEQNNNQRRSHGRVVPTA